MTRDFFSLRNRFLNLSALAFLCGLALLPLQPAAANNLSVSNVTWLPARFGSFIQFDLQWENSWRNDQDGGTAPFNYDAVWLFAKWRTNDPATGVTSDWQHVSLSPAASDHQVPANADLSVGRDGRPGEWGTKGIGVFVFRAANGSGLFTVPNVRLRWDREQDGVDDKAAVEVWVCAMEMVYVPEGSHYLGSTTGGTEAGRFHAGGYDNETPFLVTSEDALTVADEEGCLYYVTGTYCGDQAGVVSNDFPKGYAAFYCMKYEVSQAQHVDFLNRLTRTQQEKRFKSTTVGDYAANIEGQTSPLNRNGIRLIEDAGAPMPRVYANDLDSSNPPNSDNDGQWIACNYLSWNDQIAYLAWAGLRPMSELEFSKACRGPGMPVANAYIWGSTTGRGTPANMISGGTADEGPQSSTANAVYGLTADLGPLRVGCMGVGEGTREDTGSAYYGIIDMAGNITERWITIGNEAGRPFRGIHGEGVLKSDGDANVPSWPVGGNGSGYAGGNWVGAQTSLRLALRTYSTYGNTSTRLRDFGCRGVRSAP